MTINISLPKDLYEEAKTAVKKYSYSSVSELIRESLRKRLYPELTVNGFTKEFEDEILRAAKEPEENDIILETKEDILSYFKNPTAYAKRKNNR